MNIKESEHWIQKQYIEWVRIATINHAELDLLFAVPNGEYRPVKVGIKLNNEGVKKGVPDIMFPFPLGEYHGMAIEFKRPGGTISNEQRKYLRSLRDLSKWAVSVCFSADEGINFTKKYLGIG